VRGVIANPGIAGRAAAADQIGAAADSHQQQRGNAAFGEGEMVCPIEEAAFGLRIRRDGAALCGSGLREIFLQLILSRPDQDYVPCRTGRLENVDGQVCNHLCRRE